MKLRNERKKFSRNLQTTNDASRGTPLLPSLVCSFILRWQALAGPRKLKKSLAHPPSFFLMNCSLAQKILGSGFRVLGSRFWVLSWVLGSEILKMGSGKNGFW